MDGEHHAQGICQPVERTGKLKVAPEIDPQNFSLFIGVRDERAYTIVIESRDMCGGHEIAVPARRAFPACTGSRRKQNWPPRKNLAAGLLK